MNIQKCELSRLKKKPENERTLIFGKTFTDHMLTMHYDAKNGGWG